VANLAAKLMIIVAINSRKFVATIAAIVTAKLE
jgi:hypothetical protein